MFAVSNTVVYAYRVSAYRVLYDVKKINFRHTYGAYSKVNNVVLPEPLGLIR